MYIGDRACKSTVFVTPIHPLTNYIITSRYRIWSDNYSFDNIAR